MAKLAFLGLGVMGYPMAGHLRAAGHDVTVYNRNTAKAEAWVAEHGGAMARRRVKRRWVLNLYSPALVPMLICGL